MWYLRNYYILLGRDENKYLDIISVSSQKLAHN